MDTTDRLLHFYYKWHRFEKINNIDIIDFDLIQKGEKYPGVFANREEVRENLLEISHEYNSLSEKNILVSAKLEASVYYLRALIGEDIPFLEYVSKTIGVTPICIPEEALQQELEKMQTAFKKIGYSWDKESIEKYEKETKLTKREIENKFTEFKDKIVPQILNWLGITIDLQYNVKFVDVDAYWTNWTSTDNTGNLLLQFNMNERQKWVKGITEYQVFHEICGHAIQASLWKQQIQKGKLHPVLGLTSVFSFEQFMLEGMGEALFYFYPNNPYSNYGLVRQYQENFYFMVWNNAHIMANEEVNKDTIIHFMQKYLPYLTKEDIEKGIKEKTKDVLGKTYQYVYGITTYYHMLIAEKLSTEEKRKYVIDIYTNIYTPKEILERYKNI